MQNFRKALTTATISGGNFKKIRAKNKLWRKLQIWSQGYSNLIEDDNWKNQTSLSLAENPQSSHRTNNSCNQVNQLNEWKINIATNCNEISIWFGLAVLIIYSGSSSICSMLCSGECGRCKCSLIAIVCLAISFWLLWELLCNIVVILALKRAFTCTLLSIRIL